MSGVIDRFKSHAAGESAIADHRNATEILSTLVPGHRHPKSRRDGGAGMAGTEMIERAFAALEIARDSAFAAGGC